MNFAEVAQEVGNWITSPTGGGAVVAAAVVGGLWLAGKRLMADRATRKANRAEVEALLKRHQPVARINLRR